MREPTGLHMLLCKGNSMKKKKHLQIKNRNLLVIMTIICISAIALTATNLISVTPVRQAVSVVIVPFQKGINTVGTWMSDKGKVFRNTQELSDKVDELTKQVAELKEENLILTEDKEELQRLRELYNTDTSYSQYEKISANVISKDPGNWYSSFIIDKGTDDGISKDMNVIAAGGLVGLVTEVGSNWASVRSIIDDSSSVSAMTVTSGDTCVVNGDLRLIDEGKLAFEQMKSNDSIAAGERIVTSNISDKYLPGILIGTISDINDDSNHLTKTGYILPAVDFAHVREVLVIKQLKQTTEQ